MSSITVGVTAVVPTSTRGQSPPSSVLPGTHCPWLPHASPAPKVDGLCPMRQSAPHVPPLPQSNVTPQSRLLLHVVPQRGSTPAVPQGKRPEPTPASPFPLLLLPVVE